MSHHSPPVIAVVDDDSVYQFTASRTLKATQLAHEILQFQNGKEALSFLRERPADARPLPDIIFLDINMPIVDGFVFLYEFEKFNEFVKSKCKVIILSSSDNKRDIDKIVNNDHVIKFITKPLTEVALEEIIHSNI